MTGKKKQLMMRQQQQQQQQKDEEEEACNMGCKKTFCNKIRARKSVPSKRLEMFYWRTRVRENNLLKHRSMFPLQAKENVPSKE